MLERIPLSYYALAGLLNFITSIAFSFFVFYKNPKSRSNQTFSLWTFTVAGWSLCYFLWLSTEKSYLAEIYLRTLMLFVIFIPSTFTHFVLTLLKVDIRKQMNLGNYLISVFLGFTVYTQLFANRIGPFLVFPYWLKPRLPFAIHSIHFFANVIYSHFLMLRAIKHQSGIFRNQVLYVFIATAIGYIAGSINYLTWYRIPIPPFLNPLLSISVASVAYAIIRHRLMDIEVIIKKTLVFAGIFTAAYTVVAAISFLGQVVFEELTGGNRWISLMPSIVIIVLILRPLENFLIKITDKYLFQKKYDPFQLLKTFSDKVLASVLDQEAIIKISVELLTKALNLETFAIMLVNEEGDKYEISGSSGLEDKGVVFSSDSNLIMYLNKTFSPLIKRNYDKTISCELVHDMDKIKAELCIPLVFHKHLVGILAFGRKKSDKEYINEDLNILVPLSRDIAIAIVYARLYEEIRQKDKLATMGTLVAGIKHEIGNPLSSILTSTQLMMKEMETWDSVGLSQKEREEKFKNTLNEVLYESRMIGRITKKFTDFAKPGDEGMKEIVNVEESLNGALEILQNELNLRHIKIEKNIPRDIPSIFVDKDQAHQIFFNILRNAAQAIEESKKPKENAKISIAIRAEKPDRVIIDISDTGIGISEEQQKKIFEPFYTTKQKGKGTGLGLAIVRQLIGRNQGDISFKSRKGEGTTFTIEFPISKNG